MALRLKWVYHTRNGFPGFLSYFVLGHRFLVTAPFIIMGLLQVITSKTKTVERRDTTGKKVMSEEPVWNWAVANITLSAIGSSSPEILLAIVECLLTLGQPAGELGPSCIIGSGAYNLFAITAVCTFSLKAGESLLVMYCGLFCFPLRRQFFIGLCVASCIL